MIPTHHATRSDSVTGRCGQLLGDHANCREIYFLRAVQLAEAQWNSDDGQTDRMVTLSL
jgi:hypothetical protein